MLRNNNARLFILTLVHFSVDFCGGLTIPLPEPTLTSHLGVALPRVAILVGGFALFANLIQPLSAWFLPRRGAPILLAVAPPASAAIAALGLSGNYWVAALLLAVAAAGIGLVHPEAALAAHSLSERGAGLRMGIFMSGGYFGFSAGSLIGGLWLEAHTPSLAGFWILGLPALAVTLLVVASGLHRVEGHVTEDDNGGEQGPPFALSVWLCVSIATGMCLLARFLPIYLVRRFPAGGGQGWGGATVFATGVAGALCAFAWGHISEGRRRGRYVAAAQIMGLPFLLMLVRTHSVLLAPLLGLGIGATMGAVFPLSVVIARESTGAGRRLSMGMAIGGAWATGELAFILGGIYVGRFPEGSSEPIATVLYSCVGIAALTAAIALYVAKYEEVALERSER